VSGVSAEFRLQNRIAEGICRRVIASEAISLPSDIRRCLKDFPIRDQSPRCDAEYVKCHRARSRLLGV